jgi:hypothetical protein
MSCQKRRPWAGVLHLEWRPVAEIGLLTVPATNIPGCPLDCIISGDIGDSAMKFSLSALLLATSLALPGVPAGAAPLAIGEVIPLLPPEGYVFRPVYARPALGSRWEPTDYSMGRPFREPIYTAPRGYVYRTISGYAVYKVGIRKVSVKKVRTAARKRGPLCVTDIGYGRWSDCR